MAVAEELIQRLTAALSDQRLRHTQRVVHTAMELGERFGVPPVSVETAAFMHDFAREMPAAQLLAEARRLNVRVDSVMAAHPVLLHGPVAAALLAEQGLITDPAVLDAISWHTTGRADMSLLEKVVWLGDYLEPNRQFTGVDQVRIHAQHDLDQALLMALEQIIIFVVQRGWPLHLCTVEARNWLL